MKLIDALKALEEGKKVHNYIDGCDYYLAENGRVVCVGITGQKNYGFTFELDRLEIFTSNEWDFPENVLLTAGEKEYLEDVIEPFKTRVKYIKVVQVNEFGCRVEIVTTNKRHNHICITKLPTFKKGTMYKKLVINKEYTIQDLYLFFGED